MVILGYLWSVICNLFRLDVLLTRSRFLYQGREVSYSSVLDRSISSRRQALYKAHGFDIERWMELAGEAKSLRKDIGKIAEDYDEHKWRERKAAQEVKDKKQDNDIEDMKKAVQHTRESSEDRTS